MPKRPPKVCAAPGCYVTTDKGRCPACATKRHRQIDSRRGNSTQRGYDRRWRKARAIFLQENPLCVQCYADGFVRAATVVDHIVDHKGDPEKFWNPANWQPLCTPHHGAKTVRENLHEKLTGPARDVAKRSD